MRWTIRRAEVWHGQEGYKLVVCTCMGVSRYRTRSRSFVPVIGNVRRDASRARA